MHSSVRVFDTCRGLMGFKNRANFDWFELQQGPSMSTENFGPKLMQAPETQSSLVQVPILPRHIIQGFRFNEQADLSSIMAIRVTVSSPEPGLMEIHFGPLVPGEALQAPYHTDHILLKWVITSTNFATVETGKPAMGEMIIPYGYEIFQPPVISIPAITKPDIMMLMVLAVQ
jgi:hypothetical protein